ncbi:MAG: hypothetical protein WCW35_08210 [Bacteroidota bacterium]|jgi:hypothetical protein
MDISIIFIPILLAVLIIIALLTFVINKHKGRNRFTPLAGLAFGFVLAGLFTGDDRFIGYSLMGIGIILAIVDMIRKFRHASVKTDDHN